MIKAALHSTTTVTGLLKAKGNVLYTIQSANHFQGIKVFSHPSHDLLKNFDTNDSGTCVFPNVIQMGIE